MPSSPQWTDTGSTLSPSPGGSFGTNDSWPAFAGHAEPGSTVKFEIDGEAHSVSVDENGAWDFVPPNALGDGDHDFSMWAEKDGEESDRVEWNAHVQANSQERQDAFRRIQHWKMEGSGQHHERYRPMTGGTGGGDSTALTTPGGSTTTQTGSGGTGFEKGSSQGQGFEKGNDAPCKVCGEPRGDRSPCPVCGMD